MDCLFIYPASKVGQNIYHDNESIPKVSGCWIHRGESIFVTVLNNTLGIPKEHSVRYTAQVWTHIVNTTALSHKADFWTAPSMNDWVWANYQGHFCSLHQFLSGQWILYEHHRKCPPDWSMWTHLCLPHPAQQDASLVVWSYILYGMLNRSTYSSVSEQRLY